jgi:hypothetical protein
MKLDFGQDVALFDGAEALWYYCIASGRSFYILDALKTKNVQAAVDDSMTSLLSADCHWLLPQDRSDRWAPSPADLLEQRNAFWTVLRIQGPSFGGYRLICRRSLLAERTVTIRLEESENSTDDHLVSTSSWKFRGEYTVGFTLLEKAFAGQPYPVEQLTARMWYDRSIVPMNVGFRVQREEVKYYATKITNLSFAGGISVCDLQSISTPTGIP